MTFMADVFPKLQTAKDVVRQMFKKSCFSKTFEKQDGKQAQTLLKQKTFFQFFSTFLKSRIKFEQFEKKR